MGDSSPDIALLYGAPRALAKTFATARANSYGLWPFCAVFLCWNMTEISLFRAFPTSRAPPIFRASGLAPFVRKNAKGIRNVA